MERGARFSAVEIAEFCSANKMGVADGLYRTRILQVYLYIAAVHRTTEIDLERSRSS